MAGGDLLNISEIAKILSPNIGKTLTPGLNVTLSEVLPPEVLSNLELMVTIAQAAGIIFIIYIIFMIVRGIWSIRRGIKLSHMYYRINDIDRKLDILLAHDKLRLKEQELMELKEEEKGFIKRIFRPKTKRQLVVLRKQEKQEQNKDQKQDQKQQQKRKKQQEKKKKQQKKKRVKNKKK